jgi:methylated-DNA-[protein]-cysteine S-methyltransferase
MTAQTRTSTPIGDLLLLAGEDGLAEVRFAEPAPRARAQLDEYFAGERTSFDLPLALVGSPFFLRVWEAVRAIPFGETRTYGALAAELGHPGGGRAVGLANGRNPLPIIVPCHRLVGAGGSLTGYGGGLDRKRWLLDHETRVASAEHLGSAA